MAMIKQGRKDNDTKISNKNIQRKIEECLKPVCKICLRLDKENCNIATRKSFIGICQKAKEEKKATGR